MRKVFFYIILLVFIFFCIPILLSNDFRKNDELENESIKTVNNDEINENGETENDKKQNENKEKEGNDDKKENANNKDEEYNYGKYSKVRLLHKKTGEVEEIELDEYLLNVVSAEMPANYEMEALKSQAIVARTYTIYKLKNGGKHKNKGADICDDSTCCQAWISKEDRMNKWDEEMKKENWSRIEQAVEETKGKIITYNGAPINAFFHANSGGITEMPIDVWGGSGYPYLQSVETAGEEGYKQYASEIIISQKELLEKLKEKYSDIEINFDEKDSIRITEYTKSNRVKTITFGNKNISGVEARTILGLKSTNFSVENDGKNIIFKVIGYGHGVGMSQTGADAMAKKR